MGQLIGLASIGITTHKKLVLDGGEKKSFRIRLHEITLNS